MLLFPVRVEDAEVDRVPAVSIGIAAACAAAFLLTWVAPRNPDGMRADGFREILRYYEEHPYLAVQPRFVYDYLRPEARATIEQMHEKAPVTVDEATRALEQTQLDSLIEDFAVAAEASPMRRLGLVPARGLLQPGWLTHMFLHFGWMHILGNMFFFYLVGPLLEDLWGRRFFGAFYLAGGMMAALAHFGIDPRSPVVMAGASGAVAACMGAFSYRCASKRIRMAYMIGWVRRGTFLIPAWLWGGFWFAGEVFSLVSHSSEGVAVMAHIGGFLFGFGAATLVDKSGYEARALAPAVQEKTTWTQHPSTELARAALDRGDQRAAAEAYRTVLREHPLDREAAIGLARIEQDPAPAIPLLQNLAVRGDLGQAWIMALELGSSISRRTRFTSGWRRERRAGWTSTAWSAWPRASLRARRAPPSSLTSSSAGERAARSPPRSASPATSWDFRRSSRGCPRRKRTRSSSGMSWPVPRARLCPAERRSRRASIRGFRLWTP